MGFCLASEATRVEDSEVMCKTMQDWSLWGTAELLHHLLCIAPMAWEAEGIVKSTWGVRGTPETWPKASSWSWFNSFGDQHSLKELPPGEFPTVYAGILVKPSGKVSSREQSNLGRAKGKVGGGCRGGGSWELTGPQFPCAWKWFCEGSVLFL